MRAEQTSSEQFTSQNATSNNVIIDPTATAAPNDGLGTGVGSSTASGAAAVVHGSRGSEFSGDTAALLLHVGRAPRQERIQGVLRV